MSAFIKSGDTYYKNLKIIINGVLRDDLFITNYGCSTRYFDGYIDVENSEIQAMLSDIALPKGSAIYVTPGCTVPSADIRKNYTIKRCVDTGDYNVICNSICKDKNASGYCVLIPSRNTMVINRDYNAKGVYSEFLSIVHSVPGYEDVEVTDFSKIGDMKKTFTFSLNDLPEVYVKLYEGTLVKPAVSYKNLDLNFGLEVNEDILELVYRTGMQDANTWQNVDKHVLELEALNQYNWRDYPRTMYFLFSLLTYPYRNAFCCVRSRQSSQPKSVKQLLHAEFSMKAASQKDHDLALKFMKKRCGIEDTKFVLYQNIATKMREEQVPLDAFLQAFDTIVRITPKKYETTDDTV